MKNDHSFDESKKLHRKDVIVYAMRRFDVIY